MIESSLAALVAAGRMAPDWAEALVAADPEVETHLARVAAFLGREVELGRTVLPAPELVLRAFERPLAQVKVLVVGQDPYPTPGHPIGLSFAVAPDVRPLPRSLVNIRQELADDVGGVAPEHGDLSAWSDQGVLLLNRVLTVRAGQPGSHSGQGWIPFTEAAVRALAVRGGPLVAILWGRPAQSLAPLLGDVPVIASPHPSPLSARRGFFGSRPFSRANTSLVEQGADPVRWLPPSPGDVRG